ncbi:MAG: hypothetical protein R3E58_14675 [Phycisphaerae bacterium]
MNEPLRNPDAVLARLRTEAAKDDTDGAPARGRLKIFFGYAAGVGKTYTMLEAVVPPRMRADVLLGYIEPHGRPENRILDGRATRFAASENSITGASSREFDLDAALERRPELVLVDELPHTNAAGCRHTKRWQDGSGNYWTPASTYGRPSTCNTLNP